LYLVIQKRAGCSSFGGVFVRGGGIGLIGGRADGGDSLGCWGFRGGGDPSERAKIRKFRRYSVNEGIGTQKCRTIWKILENARL